METLTIDHRNPFVVECGKNDIRLCTNHKANTGYYHNSKDLLYGEVLGGVMLLPKLLGLRIKFLTTALNNYQCEKIIDNHLPQVDVSDNGIKLVVLPELDVLVRTLNCCNQIADWVKGKPCHLIPRDDTPPELIKGLQHTGDNFTILPPNVDRFALFKKYKQVLVNTTDELAIEAIWYNKPFSFMKEGGSHDMGTFRLLNILLANDIPNRRARLHNLLNSELSGFFLPGRDGLPALQEFLVKYKDNYERFTHPYRP